jgi:hypothetical protein
VAAHHGPDRREVGRPAGRGVEDGSDLAEVLGAEDAGGDHRERPGVDVAGVVELVDGAAEDADRFARADVGRRALDRPRQDALEPVDGLLVAVVAVCGRDLRTGGDVELEDRYGSCRLLTLDQEPDRQLTDLDLLARARRHRSSSSCEVGKVI